MALLHTGVSERKLLLFFFFNDAAPTEIYTLSLHDALPISAVDMVAEGKLSTRDAVLRIDPAKLDGVLHPTIDRKSTRLNSSHQIISYAVFCLKKKKS